MKLSVVVPVYNAEPYLNECLDSILSTSHIDVEVVAVDDCSTDGSLNLLEKRSQVDPRLRVVSKPKNEGPHLARKTGVAQAEGDYILFVDPDDKLAEDGLSKVYDLIACNQPDVLYFGFSAISENGLDASEVMRADPGLRDGFSLDGEILKLVFDEEEGFSQDWRIWQRAFRAAPLKIAFSAMEDARLSYFEDAYETMVALSFCRKGFSSEKTRPYVYYYGRGITGSARISVDRFCFLCDEAKKSFDSAFAYAESRQSDFLRKCGEGFRRQALNHLANDWLSRVSEQDKRAAIVYFEELFGAGEACRQLYRFVRDMAYEELSAGSTSALLDSIKYLAEEAYGLASRDGREKAICSSVRRKALSHLDELSEMRACQDALERSKSQHVKIFVSTHKDVDVPASSVFQPVQVGSCNAAQRFNWSWHDDEGENISCKNKMYCELTTQYWAWKNVEAEYYGFCHYRRYFDFSNNRHLENEFGEILADSIDEGAIKEYCLDEKDIYAQVEGFDVVTTEFKDLRRFPGSFSTPLEQYAQAEKLKVRDLLLVMDIVRELHPEYQEAIEKFLNGNRSCFCNMFIMKRDVFFEYCEWLFPILEEFEHRSDMGKYGNEAYRTPGHLAERLLNVFLVHQQIAGRSLRTKELQCLHFKSPERQRLISPAFDGSAVPIVFAADDNYAPQLATVVNSLSASASSSRKYDILVLSKNMSGRNMERVIRVASAPNISVRFFDVSRMVKSYKLETENAHISEETYYRFLVQEVLPYYDKVLYLDSDLVVLEDVARLYDIELGDNLVGAVRDSDFLGHLNKNDGTRFAYAKETLRMRNPYDYFQAGVLLLNTEELRKLHSTDEWLELAMTPYIYNDQDILNFECEGRVVYLDYRWNVMMDEGRYGVAISFSPREVDSAYVESRRSPYIIHYAGNVKPWEDPTCDFAEVFWSFARDTPFFEELIRRMVGSGAKEKALDEFYVYAVNRHAARSWKKKIADVFLPYGSRRRELLKRAASRR